MILNTGATLLFARETCSAALLLQQTLLWEEVCSVFGQIVSHRALWRAIIFIYTRWSSNEITQILPPSTLSKPFVFTVYHRQNQTMRLLLCEKEKKHHSWVGTISKELTHRASQKFQQFTVVIIALLHSLLCRKALYSLTFWFSVFLHFMAFLSAK